MKFIKVIGIGIFTHLVILYIEKELGIQTIGGTLLLNSVIKTLWSIRGYFILSMIIDALNVKGDNE